MSATWQKRVSAKNSTTSEEKSSVPPTGEDLLREATANQHSLAVGHGYINEAASVGRSVADRVLLEVAVHISRKKLIALIDSGAS